MLKGLGKLKLVLICTVLFLIVSVIVLALIWGNKLSTNSSISQGSISSITSTSSFTSETSRYKSIEEVIRYSTSTNIYGPFIWSIKAKIPSDANIKIIDEEGPVIFETLQILTPGFELNLKGYLDGGRTNFSERFIEAIPNTNVSSTGFVYRFSPNERFVISYGSIFWEEEKCREGYMDLPNAEPVKYCGSYGLNIPRISISCKVLNIVNLEDMIAECDKIIQSLEIVRSQK